MSDEDKLPQLVMKRSELRTLPPLQLPDGYTARSLDAGEEDVWAEIVSEAFQRSLRFERLSAHSYYSPERVQFICDAGGSPVATATAWYDEHWGEDCGYLHMVGVKGGHGGRGLGAQVSLAALHRMVLEGRKEAVLHTDDFRLPAIRTYLKLGFVPSMEHESFAARWETITGLLSERGPV